jgi:hypothetical protein
MAYIADSNDQDHAHGKIMESLNGVELTPPSMPLVMIAM